MAYPRAQPAPPSFWERVCVALAAQGETVSSWAREARTPHSTFASHKLKGQLPRDEDVDALCTLTGCTREFLFNPLPVDLSR